MHLIKQKKKFALIAAALMLQTGLTCNVQAAEEKNSLNYDRIVNKIDVLQSIIDDYYLFDENMESMEDGIYQGFMSGLGDEYSVYYNKEDFIKLTEDTSGNYCGIGAIVSQNGQTGLSSVIKVFKDSPAYEAGLLPGDILSKVEDVDVSQMDLDFIVSQYVRGPENTSVKLTVFRPGINTETEITVMRKSIEIPSVEYTMLDGSIGYIQVSSFDNITGNQFRHAVNDLSFQGMKKLVIDLRSNPGGVLNAAIEMLAYVLPDCDFLYTEDKNGRGFRYYSQDGSIYEEEKPYYEGAVREVIGSDSHELNIPMVILVNKDSASASEVFTGTMKDYGRAVVMGETTFGKGIVQSLIPFSDGTAVKLTVAHYFTPKGNDLHHKGIEPDIEVSLKDELKTKAVIPQDEDNQLQEAIKLLNR